jgi:hypothetical protein
MSDLRDAARQALEALEELNGWQSLAPPVASQVGRHAAINLRAALEQPEQPQEATHLRDLLKRIRQWDALDIPDSDGAYWKREIDAALEQPVQEPLSDEELDRLWREPMSADWEHREFARAIEAAHGIKENT